MTVGSQKSVFLILILWLGKSGCPIVVKISVLCILDRFNFCSANGDWNSDSWLTTAQAPYMTLARITSLSKNMMVGREQTHDVNDVHMVRARKRSLKEQAILAFRPRTAVPTSTLYLQILQVLLPLQPHEYSVDEVEQTYYEQLTRDCFWHTGNLWSTVSYQSGTTLLRCFILINNLVQQYFMLAIGSCCDRSIMISSLWPLSL